MVRNIHHSKEQTTYYNIILLGRVFITTLPLQQLSGRLSQGEP